MEKNLISVIMPCYNCEKNLFRAVESVLQQDHRNLELIMVDDGSEDDTLKIARKYAVIDKRVKVIAAKHAGVSNARNVGLKQAKGAYIAFIDSDDNYTTPRALSTMLKTLEDNQADRCICNFTHPCFEQHLQPGVYDLTDKQQLMTYYHDFFASSMPWNKLTRRECLTEPFVLGLGLGEDEIYNLANMKNLRKIVVINEVLYNYYCTPYIPSSNASAITKTVSDQDNKFTVWHMFMRNQPLREEIICRDFANYVDEMQYVRAFDFFFWAFFLMAKNRLPVTAMAHNYCMPIFADTLFQNAIQSQTGLNSADWSQVDIEKYSKLAYYAYADIRLYHRQLSLYHVFLGIMAKMFMTKKVDKESYLSQMAEALKQNQMPEAVYVNRLFDNILSEKEKVTEQDGVLNLWLCGTEFN